MELVVYGALGPASGEHELALRLLALLLERELGIPSLPEIRREAGGKPYFPGYPSLHFNLSHSRGAAVCALHDQPVGIDIERLRPAPRRLAKGMEDEAFFLLWTAKEATVKRAGRGIDALRGPLEPDSLCRRLDGFPPGWLVTVCPSEDVPARVVWMDAL